MDTVKVLSYAKLNLTLDITGKEGNYHTLDSLVVTAGLYDKIVAKKRKDHLIDVTMHGMGSDKLFPEENHAVRAGERFVEEFGTQGANITVYKNIPMGAGLGGSSADAAGVLNALARLYQISDFARLKAIADGLGSDTGYMLRGGLARMRGRGDEVEFFSDSPDMHFLLLCPKSGVSTAECYQTFDELPRTDKAGRTERCLEAYRGMGVGEAARLFGNDLFESAKSLNPDVGEAVMILKSFSPLGASMTGSGSAAFALFEMRELCEWAKSRYKGKFRSYIVDAVYPAEKKRKYSNPYSIEGD
ncbi:MAG: 4-(cytidine 5'-diphospho)-2-C-methyl-D-erythritol kinase [Clostridia bacterium]|nr:4-(cytidine 5'-diphospho)-2-C-methyl-D-erythritol kinase [Clostridia bacterium]